MSDELVQFQNYFADLAKEAKEENDQYSALINILQRYATWKMNKDGLPCIIEPGEKQPKEGAMKSTWVMAIMSIKTSRALFVPQSAPKEMKEKYKQPICRTSVGDPASFVAETVTGQYLENNDFGDMPGNGTTRHNRSCATCPYNQFGSEVDWDPSKPNSKGKACKESNVLFALVFDRDMPIPIKLGDNTVNFWRELLVKDMVVIRLPKASNGKSVEALIKSAMSKGAPLSALAFTIKQEKKEEGGVSWVRMVPEDAGAVHPDVHRLIKTEFKDKIEEYVRLSSFVIIEEDNDTRSPVDEQKIPFE